MEHYRGILVEEALDDSRLINHFPVHKVYITLHPNPADRWHLYEVTATEEQIEMLKGHVIDDWYVHFWKDGQVIALFKDHVFTFDYYDKSTWTDVLRHGRSLGIPEAQLNFPIKGL